MKSRLSAEEAAAIQRFCDENNCKPALSPFPTVYFTDKETGKEIKRTLSELVHHHLVSKSEEAKTRADEKKRLERENKWRPTTGLSS